MYFFQIHISDEETRTDSDDEMEGEKSRVKVDICCIGLEELDSEAEVLRSYPCGCVAACIAHASVWVADHNSCYQCRTPVSNCEAVPNFRF